MIENFSEGKPTLVFCSTRKGTLQAAAVLCKEARFLLSEENRQHLKEKANSLKDLKLRDSVLAGVGYHHAGLDHYDRNAVEELFVGGSMPVLLCTSTLAMGVNLPAHLVIIKSTSHYVGGSSKEYSETEIQQMMGRAGRPQFDTSATAVVMTQTHKKLQYEQQLTGFQVTESTLHKNLIEHMNAEASLKTFHDAESVLSWLQSTFLYIRIFRNPVHYSLPAQGDIHSVHAWLQDLCTQCLKALKGENLITGTGERFLSTCAGTLMARYYIAFETVR